MATTRITTEDWDAYYVLASTEAHGKEATDRETAEAIAEREAEMRAEQEADEALERRYEERGLCEPPEDYSNDPGFGPGGYGG